MVRIERAAVLIIDDDLMLLDAIRRTMALRLPEVHVEVSPSAQHALDLLAAQPYDLALCDVRMPVMDGHQFLIQAQRLYPGMPVLIMSGHTDDGEMKRTLAEGAAAVLCKPLDRDEVVVKIRETLRTRRLADRFPDSARR
jgi:DNA-binding NtrC family response regulator